jgi:hypothetical protein
MLSGMLQFASSTCSCVPQAMFRLPQALLMLHQALLASSQAVSPLPSDRAFMYPSDSADVKLAHIVPEEALTCLVMLTRQVKPEVPGSGSSLSSRAVSF